MPDTVLKPNQVVGEYLLDTPLGCGAFGEVWKAKHHVWADRVVAVKVHTSADFVRTLRQEGVVHDDLSRLESPHIVKVLGLNILTWPNYMVMEYVAGQDLRARMKGGRLTLPESLRILEGVLKGLAVAHGAGVIHRDIKPENILLDENGTPKLTDFSIAVRAPTTDSLRQTLEADPARAPSLAGTLVYMSPEQRQGAQVDKRSDIYSMGLLLFEMLTAELPHPGDCIRDFAPEIPAAVDGLFASCFARRERRFDDATAMLRAVQALLHGPTHRATGAPSPLSAPASRSAAAPTGSSAGATTQTFRPTLKLQAISTRDLKHSTSDNVHAPAASAATMATTQRKPISSRNLPTVPDAQTVSARSPSPATTSQRNRPISTRNLPSITEAQLTRARNAENASPAGVDDITILLEMLPDDSTAQPLKADLSATQQREEVLPSLEALYRRHFTANAQTLYAAGRYAQAAEEFQRVLTAMPGDFSAMKGLAMSLARVNRPKKALGVYRELVRIAPASAEIWNNVGALSLSLGKLREAERSLLRAVELKPRYAAAHANLCAVYQLQGRADDARNEANIALEIDPDNFEASYNLTVRD